MADAAPIPSPSTTELTAEQQQEEDKKKIQKDLLAALAITVAVFAPKTTPQETRKDLFTSWTNGLVDHITAPQKGETKESYRTRTEEFKKHGEKIKQFSADVTRYGRDDLFDTRSNTDSLYESLIEKHPELKNIINAGQIRAYQQKQADVYGEKNQENNKKFGAESLKKVRAEEDADVIADMFVTGRDEPESVLRQKRLLIKDIAQSKLASGDVRHDPINGTNYLLQDVEKEYRKHIEKNTGPYEGKEPVEYSNFINRFAKNKFLRERITQTHFVPNVPRPPISIPQVPTAPSGFSFEGIGQFMGNITDGISTAANAIRGLFGGAGGAGAAAEVGALGAGAAGVTATTGAAVGAAGAAGAAGAGAAATGAVFLGLTPVGWAIIGVVVLIIIVLIVVLLIGSGDKVTTQPAAFTPTPTVVEVQGISPTPLPDVTPTVTLTPPGGLAPITQNFAETITLASGKACIPPAMLEAIARRESGLRLYSAEQYQLYDTYGWWGQSTTKTELCTGYSYNTCTNAVAPDTEFGGEFCGTGERAICSTGRNVMGPMQFEISTWSGYEERVKTALSINQADRRVITHAVLGAALKLKDNSKNTLTPDNFNCAPAEGDPNPWTNQTWTAQHVRNAAERYYGKCTYSVSGTPVSGNYCKEVCDYYNELSTDAKQRVNCSTL